MTAHDHLAAMLAADSALYEQILDTPRFSFHFNELCKLATHGRDADRERLDWMIANHVTLRLQRDHDWYYAVIVDGNRVTEADHADLRAAIDAARGAA